MPSRKEVEVMELVNAGLDLHVSVPPHVSLVMPTGVRLDTDPTMSIRIYHI